MPELITRVWRAQQVLNLCPADSRSDGSSPVSRHEPHVEDIGAVIEP
jgi:hypothetical protein